MLVALGFDAAEAQRLHFLLPPVDVDETAGSEWAEPLRRWYREDEPTNPVAAVLWKTYNLSPRNAELIADSRRDIDDLILILDAFATCVGPPALRNDWWLSAQFKDVARWLRTTGIPANRLAIYITAGVTLREAVHFEYDPSARPSDAQLALLGALRAPATTP